MNLKKVVQIAACSEYFIFEKSSKYDKIQAKMKKNPNRILGTRSITIIPLFILDDSKNLLFANNTYYVVTDLFHVIFFYDRTNMYEI